MWGCGAPAYCHSLRRAFPVETQNDRGQVAQAAEKVLWDSHSWLSSGGKCNKLAQKKGQCIQIPSEIDFFRTLFSL
jgi:hypothetical protein